MMTPAWTSCVALARAIQSFGVPLPGRAQTIWAATDGIDVAWQKLSTIDPNAAILDAVRADKIDAKKVGEIFTAAIEGQIRAQAAVDTARAMTSVLADEFRSALRGDAGAELIRSLRPQWDEAAQAIAEAPFSPDTSRNPAAILELGDEAAAAYRALPGHAATLNRIFRDIITPLHAMTAAAEDLPGQAWDRASMPILAWVIDGNHKVDLAAAAFWNAAIPQAGPGGTWHLLRNAGLVLRLNTPEEARAVREEWLQSVHDEQEATARRNDEATAEHRNAHSLEPVG